MNVVATSTEDEWRAKCRRGRIYAEANDRFDPRQWDGPLLTSTGHRGARLEAIEPVTREKESVMKLIRVGVDLAKNVFQVHGVIIVDYLNFPR